MLKRFCEDAFNNSYLATIGIDFKIHTVEIAGQVIMIISAKFLSLMMLIWFWVLAETLVKIIMLNCFWRITHDHYIFRRWSFRFGTQLAKSGFTPSPLASTGTEFSPPQSQTALFKQIIWKCICKNYIFSLGRLWVSCWSTTSQTRKASPMWQIGWGTLTSMPLRMLWGSSLGIKWAFIVRWKIYHLEPQSKVRQWCWKNNKFLQR